MKGNNKNAATKKKHLFTLPIAATGGNRRGSWLVFICVAIALFCTVTQAIMKFYMQKGYRITHNQFGVRIVGK